MILVPFQLLTMFFLFCFNLATSAFSSTRKTFLHYSLQLSFLVGAGHLKLTRADSTEFLVASLLAWASSYSVDTHYFFLLLYRATARFCYYLNSGLLPTKSCPCKIIGESNKNPAPPTPAITKVVWWCCVILYILVQGAILSCHGVALALGVGPFALSLRDPGEEASCLSEWLEPECLGYLLALCNSGQ